MKKQSLDMVKEQKAMVLKVKSEEWKSRRLGIMEVEITNLPKINGKYFQIEPD